MKKFTIKTQLLLLAACMIGFQCALALVGYFSIDGMYSGISSVFNVRLPSINYLVQADRDFQQALVAERTLLTEGLSEDTKRALAKDYFANREQVKSRFGKYKALAKSKEEMALIAKFEADFQEWEKVSDSKLGIDASGAFTSGLSLPELIALSNGDVSKSFEKSRDQLDKLQEQVLDFGAKEFQTAEKSYKDTSLFTIIFSSLSLSFSLVIALVLAKFISSNIQKVSSLLREK
ncbi:MAG: hypothetical protein GW917_03650, partial [Bdellovibrionales bacterium]|nr:hypothetical protein [Bdellovibrionales bacterium]